MKITKTNLACVIVIEPQVFGDPRGWFLETWSRQRYEDAGIKEQFIQDNVSFSTKGVLRGLHFQNPRSQGKLVAVLSGEIFDVAVDIRIGSPTFGKWVSAVLSASNYRQMYVPPGFAHGFCVTSDTVLFSYKCTDYYSPSTEGGIIWNDPDLGIGWPVTDPILSPKDTKYPRLKDIATSKLPQYKGEQ
jgi:dTDP-4-dehydrorhamnose 3,5-epimerase